MLHHTFSPAVPHGLRAEATVRGKVPNCKSFDSEVELIRTPGGNARRHHPGDQRGASEVTEVRGRRDDAGHTHTSFSKPASSSLTFCSKEKRNRNYNVCSPERSQLHRLVE